MLEISLQNRYNTGCGLKQDTCPPNNFTAKWLSTALHNTTHEIEVGSQRFWLRKRYIFTCLGLSLLLRADTNSPALENSLSVGIDVLGIHKYFIAKSASWG